MKAKSFGTILVIMLMFITVLPVIVMCFQMAFDNTDFEDTWLGKLVKNLE